MEILFILFFLLWIIIPIFLGYSQTGAVSFIIVTLVLWLLSFLLPEFFLTKCWLCVSMIFGVVAAILSFHNEGRQSWLWLLMTVISAFIFAAA